MLRFVPGLQAAAGAWLALPRGCSTDWRLRWSRRARARHKAQMRALANVAIATLSTLSVFLLNGDSYHHKAATVCSRTTMQLDQFQTAIDKLDGSSHGYAVYARIVPIHNSCISSLLVVPRSQIGG